MQPKKCTENVQKEIQDRIRKYEYDHNSFMPNWDNKLLQARERSSLDLRKNKLGEEIMSRRMKMKSQLENNEDPYCHLDISIDELEKSLPIGFTDDFERCENKFDVFKGIFKEWAGTCENSAKQMFGLRQLRDQSVVLLRNLDEELFDLLVSMLLKSSSSVKIQYEILWIVTNLTCESTFYSQKIINNDQAMVHLYNLTSSDELGIVSSAMRIFNNIVHDTKMLNKIIETFPIIERIIQWINQIIKKYKQCNTSGICNRVYLDDYSAAMSFVYLIIDLTEDSYSKKFEQIYSDAVSTFCREVEELSQITFNHKTITAKTDIITRIMVTIYVALRSDGNLLRIFLDGDFIKSLLRIFEMKSFLNSNDKKWTEEPISITRGQMIRVSRILAEMLSQENDEGADFILRRGMIEAYERELEETLQNNCYDGELLEDMALGVSNITAGTVDQIKYVLMKSNLAINFLRIAEIFQERKYIFNALYIFYNAFVQGDDQCKVFLLASSVLSTCYNVVDLISTSLCMDMYKEIIVVAQDFLRIIFEYLKDSDLDGLLNDLKQKLVIHSMKNILERLELHCDAIISRQATSLMCEVFSESEEICSQNSELEKGGQ